MSGGLSWAGAFAETAYHADEMLATKGLCEVRSNQAGKRERTPPNRFIHPGKSRRPFGRSMKHVQESANPRHPTKVVIRARNEHGAEAWFGATQEAHADTPRRRTDRQVQILASGVLRVAVVVASMLISSSCSMLNQPINPDAQSAQTGGATTSGFGNGGAGGSSGADTTQACLAALASITCPTSGLEVPCLASISHCMLDNCAAWEPACAKCMLGPCCAEYAAWSQVDSACSQNPGCDSYGASWAAWRQCGVSNCVNVCNI